MNVDEVLVSLGMGRYQFTGCVLFGIVVMYSNVSPSAYVFTAGDLKYRCVVPQCDDPNPAARTYEPSWLKFTTPFSEDTKLPRKCQRFAANRTRPGDDDDGGGGGGGMRCESSAFDPDAVRRCVGRWVFEDPENTIGTEFGIMCEENKWKLSMVGSANNIGQLIGIPMSGIIADKFGRKFAMVFCAVSSATISIIQSFSNNYVVFLILELLSSTVSSGIYTVTFVLAMESVLPNHRVFYYSLLECFYPSGAALVALIASQVKDWRFLLRISNIPGLLFLSYLWITDESMRWLQMQGKHDRVIGVLKRIAGINKKSLPIMTMDVQIPNPDDFNSEVYTSIIYDVIHSRTLLWRTVRCSFVWTSITLVYYGLSINSTDFAGDKYLNFALVSLVEIPACLLNWMIMEGLSRKMALSCMLALSGITCILNILTPETLPLIKLLLLLISKLAVSVAFNITYMLTVEIFPTRMRTIMLAVCSMIGRLGSTLAPQMSLLGEFFGKYLIMLVFGLTAFVAAAVTMTLPESKNIKLPDTIDEAERIGTDRLLPPANSKDGSTENA